MAKRTLVDPDLIRRLAEHAADCEREPSDVIAELVRDYLDGTGVWAEVSWLLRQRAELRELLARDVGK